MDLICRFYSDTIYYHIKQHQQVHFLVLFFLHTATRDVFILSTVKE